MDQLYEQLFAKQEIKDASLSAIASKTQRKCECEMVPQYFESLTRNRTNKS